MPPRVLFAGEAFEDLVFVGLPRLPKPGEEVRTNQFSATLGGGAVITAVASARLGLNVSLVSGLSDAAAGRLRKEGIRVTNLRKPTERPAVTAALSTRNERAFVTFDGVNVHLESRVGRVLRSARASHVHLALYPRDTGAWRRRVASLRRRGITTSWDFGWNDVLARDPGLTKLIDELTVVFLNEREVTLYAGVRRFDQALKFWRARRPIVVMKLGAKGSRVCCGAGEWAVAPPKVKVVDTTGAGDAYNGGFLASWLRGQSMPRCLEAGNRVGAASTRKAGGIEALPRRRKISPRRTRRARRD